MHHQKKKEKTIQFLSQYTAVKNKKIIKQHPLHRNISENRITFLFRSDPARII